MTLLVGWQEGHPACKKTKQWGAGMVICLELHAYLHMAQLMPLPLTASCFSKVQVGFTFLVPAHPGSPSQRAIKRVCVCLEVRLRQSSLKIQRLLMFVFTELCGYFEFLHVSVFRKSFVCQPNFDDSSSSADNCSTNARLLVTTFDGHRAKVVRKSRRIRTQKALSFNCRQLSVAVQTDDSSVAIPVLAQPLCVSVGTQTDDVVIVSVSQQLSSDASDRLFKSGHSGLLPALRTSDDAHSASYDRDTDSGHMSDTEMKLLTVADCSSKDVKDSEVSKSLSVVSGYHASEETNASAVIHVQPQSAEQISKTNDICQLSKSAAVTLNRIPCKMLSVMPQKLSSSEHVPLSRWTTATKLDILDENKEGITTSTQRETFFAPLDMSASEQTALKSDVDAPGTSVNVSNQRESRLPLPSSRMSSVNNQTTSSVSFLHSDIVTSSDGGQSQSSVGTRHDSKQNKTRLLNYSSSSSSECRPSAGSSHRCSSKGLQQSHSKPRRSKPRVSVGRKSLSKPGQLSQPSQSAAARDRCYATTKLSRPAVWLMSATKASRSKVMYCTAASHHSFHTYICYTHTHPFNSPLSRTTWVSWYQKGKTSLDFTEARDSEWQWRQLSHMQVCTSLQTDNHTSILPLSFYRPGALPAAQPTASKH